MATYQQLILAAEEAAKGEINTLMECFSEFDKDSLLKSVFSPSHPLTLCLFLLPEYLDPALYVDHVYKLACQSDDNLELQGNSGFQSSASVAVDKSGLPFSHVEARANALISRLEKASKIHGWTSENTGGRQLDSSSIYSLWIKIRCHLIDACAGQLDFNTPVDVPYLIGVVQVINRFESYYGSRAKLELFDAQSPEENVEMLLSHVSTDTIARDVSELVVPYVTEICNSDYFALQKWILNKKNLDYLVPLALFPQVASSIVECCYNNSHLPGKWDILGAIYKNLKNIDLPENSNDSSSDPNIADVTSSWLVRPLSQHSVAEFGRLIRYGELISVKLPRTTLSDVLAAKYGSQESQTEIVQQLILPKEDSRHVSFYDIQENLKLLQSEGLFRKVSPVWINENLLKAALDSAHFEFSKNLASAVPSVKNLALSSFERFFDSASNGNITRGGMKKAYSCIELLNVLGYSNDPDVLKSEALSRSMHELSHYTLAFKPGVPARPAELKYMDPYELIGILLESNAQAYTQPDKLSTIIKDFMMGVAHVPESAPDTPEIRLRAMCADTALANNDFETAYGLCIPKLSTLKGSQVAWTACFQVGKYVSAYWEDIPPAKILNDQKIILTAAIKICPAENIANILSYWKKLEKISQEAGEYGLPSFSSRSGTNTPEPSFTEHRDWNDSTSSLDTANAGRKRDQISKLMVSGLAWAIGANSSAT